MKKVLVIAALVLFGGTLIGLDVAAARSAQRLNPVMRTTPYVPTAEGKALHQALLIADLHADPLLWSRDLNLRGKMGHTDVPRLLEGNVALQVFGVVTQTPKNMNPDRNDDRTDEIRLLAVAQRWPPPTWTSLKARALYQAGKLTLTAQRSGGRLEVIRTRQELETLLEGRAAGRQVVGAILALEGMHALEGDPANVDALFEAGFRILGPAHFFDNAMSGSAHGVAKGGLTQKGRQVLARMEALGMTVDLAHAPSKTFDEVLAASSRPVIVSHTGVRGTCDNNRNLSDAQLRKLAHGGGVVGIGFWPGATCGKDAAAIARAVRYAVEVSGEDHVALGSDYDGAVAVPFDAAGLVELTDALLAQGLGRPALEKIMGGNVLRVLRQNLPQK
jgi:membrane dipeptidase